MRLSKWQKYLSKFVCLYAIKLLKEFIDALSGITDAEVTYANSSRIKNIQYDFMIRTNRLFVSVFLFGMSTSMLSFAADDAYLKMLDGEAEELELDQSGQLKQEEQKSTHIKQSDMWGGDLQSDEIPKGLLPEEFESLLKQNFYGTYMFFNKLDSTDKQTVFYRYSKADSPDPEAIRQNILDLLRR